MKKLLLLTALFLTCFVQGQSYDDYLAKANQGIDSGNRSVALSNANKALELQPNSVDAKWLKVRASLTTGLTEEQLNVIIQDLDFIVGNGGATAKAYNAIGVAESELGSTIYRWKKAKEGNGLSDDNTAYIKEQTGYYNEALMHYEKAVTAFNEAIKINPQEEQSYKYKIRDAQAYITEIQAKINELKKTTK